MFALGSHRQALPDEKYSTSTVSVAQTTTSLSAGSCRHSPLAQLLPPHGCTHHHSLRTLGTFGSFQPWFLRPSPKMEMQVSPLAQRPRPQVAPSAPQPATNASASTTSAVARLTTTPER